jgi:signal transduction histidine kinase/ActR/RegA family two-component response regulator
LRGLSRIKIVVDTTVGFDLIFSREDLQAALFVSLLTACLIVGLLVYLNRTAKRRYFTIWTVAWVFYALWLLLNFLRHGDQEDRVGFVLKQCCIGASAVFLLWGSAEFLRIKTRGQILGLFIVFLFVWSCIGAFHLDRPLEFQIPLFSLIGFTSILASWCYFHSRAEKPYLGTSMLAFGFLFWGLYLIAFPFFKAADQLSAVFLISVILHLFIAIGMIILTLEEEKSGAQRTSLAIAEHETQTRVIKTRAHSAEKRFRHLFEQANDAIVVASAKDFSILELNEKARMLLGIGPLGGDQVQLAPFLAIDLPESPPTTGETWFRFVTELQSIKVQRRDGHITKTLVDGSEIKFGDHAAYQVIFREQTEKIQLEQQLRQAEKLSALGQMISGIAHELNNPLTAINGYLELILENHDLADTTRGDLEKVASEGNRAAKLVTQFLHFAHERQAQRAVVDINQTIRRVVELREFEFRIAGVDLKLDLDESLPRTLLDPDQAQQILLNLINNALHALVESPPPLKMTIRSRAEPEWIRLEIEDSGPGVTDTQAPHIFEPFFTTKEVGSGTGLGLSIAHSIMTDHGGRIEYRNAESGGAIFTLLFPVTTDDDTDDTETEIINKAQIVKQSSASGPASILVLDDEKSIADMLGEMLEILGHTPTVCNAAGQALELIKETDFDLILSDYRMPNINGEQFYREVLKMKPDLASRIIFLSGDVVNQETQAFLQSTGNPKLDKPFNLAAVREAIELALSERVE